MIKIKKLPPHLIAQIAAGEVIERPSYAVKELIDNAIDADASEITIQLENYGLKKITVSDNGNGMSKDDLFESYKIHTTSKIENEDSLNAIKSMGFRGEALASISAISNLLIKTKTKNDIAGYQIELSHGKITNEQPIGMPQGTVIEIDNIYSNIPARKKFLKSSPTELRNIIEVFLSFALAFPQIRFSLNHNNRLLYEFTKTDQFNRISSILNETITQQFLSITSNDSHIKMYGYVAKPQLTTTSTNKQYLFINNRRVTDKTISQTIKDSYAELIQYKQNPIFILFLHIPHELVDVNVHPRKEEIALFNQKQINETIAKTVSDVLKKGDLTFSDTKFKKEFITKGDTGSILRAATNDWQVKSVSKMDYENIVQFNNLYLFIPTKSGMLIIDQHAAHERILYEQFKTEFLKQKQNLTTLQKPITLNLSHPEKLLIEEHAQEIKQYGLTINQLDYTVTQVAKVFKDRNIQRLIKELLEELEQTNKTKKTDETSERIIRFLACKNAIKAGDKLSKVETTSLVKKLESTKNNYTCPHGRPTKYILSLNELNNLFKRS